jgi:hypothetical protein
MFQYIKAIPDSNDYCRVMDANVRLNVYLVVKIKDSLKKVWIEWTNSIINIINIICEKGI